MMDLTKPAHLRRARWAALGLAGLLIVGCSSEDDSAADAPDVEESGDAATDDGAADDGAASTGADIEIVSVADSFSPATLTVAAGTDVTWTSTDGADHTATADDGAWDSGVVSSGGTFTFTAADAGTYSYFCAIHPSMTGELVVT